MVRKGIVSTTLIIGFVFFGFSQNDKQTNHSKERNYEKRATMKVERFSKATEVPQDKQDKLIQVLTEFQEKRIAQREQENVTKEERKALYKEHNDKVNEVLETEELVKAWREFNEAERQKRRRYMKHKRKRTKESYRLKERLEKE